MDAVSILLKCLKKKRVINDLDTAKKETKTCTVTLRKNEDLFIRDAITGLGTILEENLEQHYYITSVKVGSLGNVLAYAIIQRDDATATIAVYAHEGLIKQNLTGKATSKLQKVLC